MVTISISVSHIETLESNDIESEICNLQTVENL